MPLGPHLPEWAGDLSWMIEAISLCTLPSLVLRFFYKHVTNLDSMSPSDGIMVLDLGPPSRAEQEWSGRLCSAPVLMPTGPDFSSSQVLLGEWGSSVKWTCSIQGGVLGWEGEAHSPGEGPTLSCLLQHCTHSSRPVELLELLQAPGRVQEPVGSQQHVACR